MATRQKRNMGLVAAAILAGVTLAVFGVLQDYGPESAIRRFHLAVLKDDAPELQSVTLQRINSPSVALLIRRVLLAHQTEQKYYIARMDRRPLDVRAAVVYVTPQGFRTPMIWVVVKQNASWKVDADRTLTVVRDALGY